MNFSTEDMELVTFLVQSLPPVESHSENIVTIEHEDMAIHYKVSFIKESGPGPQRWNLLDFERESKLNWRK